MTASSSHNRFPWNVLPYFSDKQSEVPAVTSLKGFLPYLRCIKKHEMPDPDPWEGVNWECGHLTVVSASPDPAGSRELVPSRLLPLRGVLQGAGRRALHRRPPQQHLLRGRLQQVGPRLPALPRNAVEDDPRCILGLAPLR